MNFKLIIFLLFLNLGNSFAQNFKGGIHGGLASCQVDGDNLSGYNKPGIIAGGFVTLNKSEKISFQVELEYIQKGSRFVPKGNQLISTVPMPGGGNSFYMRLGYVEMPFMIRYTNNKFMYEGGLSFGSLLHSYTGNELGVIPFTAMNPEFLKFEYSLNIGISRMISDKLTACFRYNYSILPIRIAVGSNILTDPFSYPRVGQYNNNLQFTIRYLLN